MDNNDFLKSLSKSLIEATKIVLEGKTHTVPKTEKEKKLAALAEPKDKITHADVLKGRGVVKEAEMDGVADGDGDKEEPMKKAFADKKNKKSVEEGKWDYPKHMTKTVTTSDMDTTNAARNREERKAWRKKEKAKAHAVLMKGMRKEEVEQIDELSKGKMLKYLAANKKDDAKAREQGDMDKMTKRMRGTDMAVRKYTAKPGSKYVKVPATEEVEVEVDQEQIDEAMSSYDRYTSTHAATKNLLKSIGDHLDAHKKAAVAHKGYYSEKKGPTWGHVGDIDHIHSQLKDIHDRLAQQGEYAKENAAMREDVELTEEEKALLEELDANFDEMNAEIELDEARRGRPPKNAAAAKDEEPAALGYQLRKAASINKPVHFMNGEKKEVLPKHITAFNDHMAARKTAAEKAAFQGKAHKSHADFVKAVSEPVPHAKKDTGEIVKYR